MSMTAQTTCPVGPTVIVPCERNAEETPDRWCASSFRTFPCRPLLQRQNKLKIITGNVVVSTCKEITCSFNKNKIV